MFFLVRLLLLQYGPEVFNFVILLMHLSKVSRLSNGGGRGSEFCLLHSYSNTGLRVVLHLSWYELVKTSQHCKSYFRLTIRDVKAGGISKLEEIVLRGELPGLELLLPGS